LDPQRREDLLTRLAESEQAMLTTTDLDLFTSEFMQKARLWQVSGGRVIATLNTKSENRAC
jgi:recombinational DNA repair ATPase RecF